MKQLLPVTSHLAKIIATLPIEEGQPRTNPAFGSILSRYVSQPYLHPEQILLYQWLSDVRKRLTYYETPVIAGCDSLIWNPSFTSPLYPSEDLATKYEMLVQMGDLKYFDGVYWEQFFGETDAQDNSPYAFNLLNKVVNNRVRRPEWAKDDWELAQQII